MTRQTKGSKPRKSPAQSATANPTKADDKPTTFEDKYPTITHWVKSRGWIEIGRDSDYRYSMVRALDDGGMVWESDKDYASLDDVLRDLENGLSKWLAETG